MSRKLILASQSPRRRYLLGRMGLTFEQVPSQFEEYFDDDRPAEQIAKELGLSKALDVAKRYPDAIVIGSDLIVVLDGKQIGKPADEAEAKAMLRNLSGRNHELVCSVAVVCLELGYQRVLIDNVEVEFDQLTEDFIDEYGATGTTYDKAGGYAIQHPLLRPHVVAIRGRLDTIIGLPTSLVSELLRDFDIDTPSLNLDPNRADANVLFE